MSCMAPAGLYFYKGKKVSLSDRKTEDICR
nr:MAG TPA: hypothetical protein [Caudoviricetes sp.]